MTEPGEKLHRSPKEGEYLIAVYKGEHYEGRVEKIRRMPSGAVCAFIAGKFIPITTYASWYKVKEFCFK